MAVAAVVIGIVATGKAEAAVGILVLWCLFWCGVALYFVPIMVAAYRQHKQFKAIAVLNVLAGWTFVGWVVALVWAVME